MLQPEILASYGVPTKENVDYNRIYEYDVTKLPITELFFPYEENRGGMDTKAIKYHVNELSKLAIILPILVDIRSYRIMDGNCRFKAFLRKLERMVAAQESGELILRVMFYDADPSRFNDIVLEINNSQKSWSASDCVKNLILVGSVAHKRLEEFCKEVPGLSDMRGPKFAYACAALGFGEQAASKSGFEIEEDNLLLAKRCALEMWEQRSYLPPVYQSTSGVWYGRMMYGWRVFRDSVPDLDVKVYNEFLKACIDDGSIELPADIQKRSEWRKFYPAVYLRMINRGR